MKWWAIQVRATSNLRCTIFWQYCYLSSCSVKFRQSFLNLIILSTEALRKRKCIAFYCEKYECDFGNQNGCFQCKYTKRTARFHEMFDVERARLLSLHRLIVKTRILSHLQKNTSSDTPGQKIPRTRCRRKSRTL